MNTSEQDKPTLTDGVVDKIKEHYNHAREKHPGFVDRLFLNGGDVHRAENEVGVFRSVLKSEEGIEDVCAETVLRCELAEAAEAFARGDKSHAIEELYDTIAVLLRIVDVIDGRQKLGEGK